MKDRLVYIQRTDTGEIYPLGPMYGTVDNPEYARRKLEREALSYPWQLVDADGVVVGQQKKA